MSIILKLMVSILSPSKGNKKYSSSAVTKVLEKLSTSLGMNFSTELRVLFGSNKQFNDDCLKEKSGLIKLLNSKFEFFESPWQLMRLTIQINAKMNFNLNLKYLNNEIIVV
tara:strand:- start:992 stop:1324 length:333 start_codon:yes stop_codon:yes gene_type:complete